MIGSGTAVYFVYFNKKPVTKKELPTYEKIEKIYSNTGPRPTSSQLESSVKELEDQAEKADSVADKQNYYTAIVDMSANNRDFKTALENANKAEDLSPTAHTAEVIAAVYMQQGDFKNAAKYYQIAADRCEKTDDPSIQSPYNDYMIYKKAAEEQIK